MMRENLIVFLVLASVILTSTQVQSAFAQSFFDDFTKIFENGFKSIESYFGNILSNTPNNKQDTDVFRALGETIQAWTDDFDQEKKTLKEKQIQNEIDLAAKQRELEESDRQLQAEQLAKEQKQRELDQRQQQLDTERLAKEQKQNEIEQQQRQLEDERLANEQKQYEIEQQQRQLEAERLAKEQKQRELEQQQRQLEAERLAKEQKQRELEQQQIRLALQKIESDKQSILAQYSWSPFIMGLTDGELTYYVQPLPSYASNDVRNQVESLATWMDGQTMYGGIKLKRVYQQEYSDFSINWVKDYQEDAIGRQVGNYLIVGLGTNNCYGEWTPFNGYTVYKIMWHEVGHALGYTHVSDSNNIMYEKGTGNKFDWYHGDSITLPDGAAQSIPLCYGSYFGYTAQTVGGNNGFHVYVVPPNSNPRDVISGKASFYLSCSEYEREMSSVSKDCNVVPGSYLLIYNPSTLGLGNPVVVDVKIADTNGDKRPNFDFDESQMYFDKDFINYVLNLFR